MHLHPENGSLGPAEKMTRKMQEQDPSSKKKEEPGEGV
jgi:hypothetical protein